MKRTIVHSDINHAYAQIEEMRQPALRKVPMAVGGSVEKRSGIILAKNDLAKRCGIKTGETLGDAMRKCPDLRILHPDYEAYMYYTEKVKDVYRQYTDKVESFGLDEAWIDLTGSARLFGDPVVLAKTIQREVYDRYGITVSMGVSWNKVFAKLGSDFDKHLGFSCITPHNYKDVVWPLDASDLIMVGRHTEVKLNQMGIFTIGDLANADGTRLMKRLGKMGGLLWRYANGLDDSPVCPAAQPIQSVGNSKTLVKDVTDWAELSASLRILAESVAQRLRDEGKKARVISVSLRGSDLFWKSAQTKRAYATDLARDILNDVLAMAKKLLASRPFSLRSVGIHASDLCDDGSFEVLDLFSAPEANEKQRALESVMQDIRRRYGPDSCRMASLEAQGELADFDPLGRLHQVHPVGFLKGPI